VGTAVKKLQVLTTDVAQDQFIQEWVDTWIKQKRNIILCRNWKNAAANTPVFCYSDLTNPNVPTWLQNQQPAVYVGRGYLGNHLHKKRMF
jgi:hypothetical protein